MYCTLISCLIVALRNEKGSYSRQSNVFGLTWIVALRNEKGSYSRIARYLPGLLIVALRNEKGSYSLKCWLCR